MPPTDLAEPIVDTLRNEGSAAAQAGARTALDEQIAFDNISKPEKPEREDTARNHRNMLVRRTADHWRARGFIVEGDDL